MAFPDLHHHNIQYVILPIHQGRGFTSCLKPETPIYHYHDSETGIQCKQTQRACGPSALHLANPPDG